MSATASATSCNRSNVAPTAAGSVGAARLHQRQLQEEKTVSRDRKRGTPRRRRTRGGSPGRRVTAELLVQYVKLLIVLISLFSDMLH